MVAAPWRRLAHAARWNGQAPQVATGAASVRDSHCQLVNCSAGTIAISSTGTVSATEIASRWRRAASSAGSPSCLVRSRLAAGAADRPACCGRLGAVADGLDRGDQLVGHHTTGIEVDGRLLGGEVDGGGDPVELVEALLDPVGAGRARHAGQRQVDMAVRGRPRAHGWCPSSRRGFGRQRRRGADRTTGPDRAARRRGRRRRRRRRRARPRTPTSFDRRPGPPSVQRAAISSSPAVRWHGSPPSRGDRPLRRRRGRRRPVTQCRRCSSRRPTATLCRALVAADTWVSTSMQ